MFVYTLPALMCYSTDLLSYASLNNTHIGSKFIGSCAITCDIHYVQYL